MQVLIRTIKPDILLTDIRMPNIDGITMTSKINELDEAITQMVANLEGLSPKEINSEEPVTDKAEESQAASFIINSALQYMNLHFARHIRLSDVADGVYVSQWHLSKLLNRYAGKSFFDNQNYGGKNCCLILRSESMKSPIRLVSMMWPIFQRHSNA